LRVWEHEPIEAAADRVQQRYDDFRRAEAALPPAT
jgi:hypothetical protein